MIGVSILQSTEEHMYSVVDKSKKKKKSTETPMYSVVDKSKKKKKTSSPVCSYTICVRNDTVHVLSYMHAIDTCYYVRLEMCTYLYTCKEHVYIYVGCYSSYKHINIQCLFKNRKTASPCMYVLPSVSTFAEHDPT